MRWETHEKELEAHCVLHPREQGCNSSPREATVIAAGLSMPSHKPAARSQSSSPIPASLASTEEIITTQAAVAEPTHDFQTKGIVVRPLVLQQMLSRALLLLPMLFRSFQHLSWQHL